MKSLAKNSILNAVYNVLNILFPLVTSSYVTRILLPAGVGKVAYAQSIVYYFVLLAMLGIPNYGLREIARIRDNQKKKNKLFTELVIINAISTVFSVAVYAVLVFRVTELREQFWLFFATGLLVVFNLINFEWLYQAEEEYSYIVKRSILVKILSIVAIFIFVRNRDDYAVYALISTLASAANYIFNFINLRHYVRFDFQDIEIRKHLKPIFIMAGGIFLSSIYSKIDITMLGFLTSDEITGYYTYGHKIVELVATIATAITGVFAPRLSYYFKNDIDKFYDLLEKGIDILLLVVPPMAVGIFIMAPEIIEILFGSQFLRSAKTVRMLSVLVVIKSFGDLLCYQLSMCTGNEKERLPASFMASVANVVGNALLIPVLAEIGVAISSVISEVIVNGYQLVKMRMKFDFNVRLKPLFQSIVSTSVMCIVCIMFKQLSGSMFFVTVVTILISVIVYGVLNIVLGNEIVLRTIKTMKSKILKV